MKMLRNRRKDQQKRDAGKIITGLLVGSLFGATVALLMAPTAGEETRRKITDGAVGVKEKMKTAAGNIESKARELAEDVNDKVKGSTSTAQRRRTAAYSDS